jgi:hypothetical protein
MSGRNPSRYAERRRGRVLGVAFLLLATSLALPVELLAEAAGRGIPTEVDEASRASFDEFASVWMDRLHQTGAGSLQRAATGASQRVFGPEFRTELRATGDSEAPYLGLLRYVEHSYSCSSSSAPRCRVSHSTPILEIFHFRNGRWVH